MLLWLARPRHQHVGVSCSSSYTILLLLSTAIATISAQAIINVSVGLSTDRSRLALTFSPNIIKQQVGGQVRFLFYPGNHSVAQSTFNSPCAPIAQDASQINQLGFFSGFNPVALSDTSLPTFTITVKDEEPVYFYCSQDRHCQQGMVGVINPKAGEEFEQFVSNAAAETSTQTPNDDGTVDDNATNDGGNTDPGSIVVPSISSTGSTPPSMPSVSFGTGTVSPNPVTSNSPLPTPPSMSASTSASFDPTSPSVTAFPTAFTGAQTRSTKKVPASVIIGGVFGLLALLAMIGIIAGFWIARRRKDKKKMSVMDIGAGGTGGGSGFMNIERGGGGGGNNGGGRDEKDGWRATTTGHRRDISDSSMGSSMVFDRRKVKEWMFTRWMWVKGNVLGRFTRGGRRRSFLD